MRRRRRARGVQPLQILLAVCAVIVVVGGGFLLWSSLSRGGETTPPTEADKPSASATPTPSQSVEGTLTPEGARAAIPADVAPDADYADAVGYSLLMGYQALRPDGGFAPDSLATCVEAAKALGAMSGNGEEMPSQYTDDALLYQAGLEQMLSAAAQSLGAGPQVGVGARRPELAVSRAQLAQALLKLDAAREEGTLAKELLPSYELVKVSLSADTQAQLQSAIETSIKRHGAPGAQVAIIQNGKVVAELAAGWATKNTDPMTVEHKMRVASISKVVVGMNIMALAEDGVVDLDKPIGEYWGAAFQNPYYPDPITMRNIMTHTSSIIAAGDNTSRAYDDVKALLSSSRGYTNTKPGDFSGWAYNNYAFSVMGQTAELAAGETMDAVLNRRFCDALGIDTAFEPGGIRATNLLTTLYKEDGTPWRTPADLKQNLPYTTPGENGKYFAGGLTISAGDLAKLVAILANDGRYEGLKFMEPETVAQMETLLPEPNPDEGYYQGFPLDYQKGLYGREGIFYHNGNAYGAFTCASYDPITGDGVVVLTNGAYPAKRNGVYIVCNEINEAVYGALAG